MATINVKFQNIEVKNFADELTGEMIEHFALNFDGDVPCKRKNDDGTYRDDKTNVITKKSNVIRAMIQNASSELASVRRLRGKRFEAVDLNSLLAGSTLTIDVELVKAGDVVDDYKYNHDGYRYNITSIVLGDEIKNAVVAARQKALANALGI